MLSGTLASTLDVSHASPVGDPLETPTRVRQRIAIEIWSNYQDYICARLKFADPTPDKQRANEDEAVTNAAEQELHAQRYAIQAYLHRTHQPLELGV